MTAHALANDGFSFAEEPAAVATELPPWKILVVDDEDEVHKVTRLALTDFSHFGRPLQFIEAYSGAEAIRLMREHPDIALVLMDVVMESEHAGLNAVLAIRNELKNRLTRIVVRTGQPGHAPEGLVINHYDVNDYREKTEITARKLHTLVHNGLSLYRELAALTSYKEGLEQVIGASALLHAKHSEEKYARSALQQLAILLYAESPRMPSDMLMALREPGQPSRVLAGTGYYEACIGRKLEDTLNSPALIEAERALRVHPVALGPRYFTASAALAAGGDLLIYIAGDEPARPADIAHVGLFCRNLAAGYDNLRLERSLKESQRNLILLLSTAAEQRLQYGGGHGRRVGTYVRTLGELYGLGEEVLEWLPLASTLHDIGQVAVPDAILNKQGPLTPDEQAVFETHARWGEDLLSSQEGEILKAAALIAAQHHERWDGQGYPNLLAGAAIHLHARITALADALDERLHGRNPCSLDEAIAEFERESGKRFDPGLVTLLARNVDRFRTPEPVSP